MRPSQAWLLAALLFKGFARAQSTSSSTSSPSSSSTSASSTTSSSSNSSSSTPTNNPAVPGVMDYVACVFVEDRETSLQLVDSSALVEPRRCQNTCAALGRQYASLQGSNCFCNAQGVDLVFLLIADQELCSDPCSGDPGAICGSIQNERDSLYQRVADPSSTTVSSPTGSSTSSAPTSTASVTRNPGLPGVMRYAGCVAIPAPEVDFLIVQFDLQVEPLGCQRQCADRGDRFAALLGQSCSCNRTADPRITYTNVESNCNIDCAGNGAYKCGGNLGFGQTYYSLYERDTLDGTNSSSISTLSPSTSSTATGSSTGINGSSITTSSLANSVTISTSSTASTTTGSSSISSSLSSSSGTTLPSAPSGSPSMSTTGSLSSSAGTTLPSTPSGSLTSQVSNSIATTSTLVGSSSSGTPSPATSSLPSSSASTSPSAPSGSLSSQIPVSIASTSTLSGGSSLSGTLSSATTSPTTASSAPLGSVPSSGALSPTIPSSTSGTSPASTVPSSGTATTSNTATSLIPIPSLSAFVNVPVFLNIQGLGGGGAPPEATPA